MLVFLRLPEDDLKEIEICRSINGICVKVCILIRVRWLVLSIKRSLFVFSV